MSQIRPARNVGRGITAGPWEKCSRFSAQQQQNARGEGRGWVRVTLPSLSVMGGPADLEASNPQQPVRLLRLPCCLLRAGTTYATRGAIDRQAGPAQLWQWLAHPSRLPTTPWRSIRGMLASGPSGLWFTSLYSRRRERLISFRPAEEQAR